jgi:hypothetical protein
MTTASRATTATTQEEGPTMTTTELALPVAFEATSSSRRHVDRLAAVLRSEWIKATTVRTNTTILAAAAVVGLLSSWAAAVFITDEGMTAAQVAAGSTALTAVLAAIAGILLFSAEAQHGTLAGALTAQPSRWPVVAGKAVVATGLGLALGVIGLLTGFAGALAGGLEVGYTSGVPSTMLWALLYTCGSAVLGLGVGMVVRHSAGAVSGLLVWWLVVEGFIVMFAPGEVVRFVPFDTGWRSLGIVSDLDPPRSSPPVCPTPSTHRSSGRTSSLRWRSARSWCSGATPTEAQPTGPAPTRPVPGLRRARRRTCGRARGCATAVPASRRGRPRPCGRGLTARDRRHRPPTRRGINELRAVGTWIRRRAFLPVSSSVHGEVVEHGATRRCRGRLAVEPRAGSRAHRAQAATPMFLRLVGVGVQLPPLVPGQPVAVLREARLHPRELPQVEIVERSAQVAVAHVAPGSPADVAGRHVAVGVTSVVEVQVSARVAVLVEQQVGPAGSAQEPGHDHEVGELEEAVAGIARDHAAERVERGPPAGVERSVVVGWELESGHGDTSVVRDSWPTGSASA